MEENENDLEKCRICNCSLSFDVVQVGEKGLRSLYNSSELRLDGMFPRSQNLSSITLHKRCRKMYTNPKYINAAVRRIAAGKPPKLPATFYNLSSYFFCGDAYPESGKEESKLRMNRCSEPDRFESLGITESLSQEMNDKTLKTDTEIVEAFDFHRENKLTINRCPEPGSYESSGITESLSQAMNDNTQRNDTEIMEAFDFHQQCLFCKQDASELFVMKEMKKSQEKRIIVHNIKKVDTGDKFLAVAMSRDDELSKEIRKRIQGVDLLINGARYHANCARNYMTKHQKKNVKRGRPLSKEVDERMQQVYDYIEADMDAHFSIAEIRGSLGLEMSETQTIRRRLLQRYGDKLHVYTTKENTEIFCFVATTAHKALLEKAAAEEAESEHAKTRREMPEVMQNDISIPSCRVCGLVLYSGDDDVVSVKSRGQIRLKYMSDQRQDSKFTEVSDEPVLLHTRCRLRYTVLRKEHYWIQQVADDENDETAEDFDFHLHCVFCKKDAPDHFIENEEQKSLNDKTTVCCVMTKKTVHDIISASLEHNDDWSEEVRKTILRIDAAANNARYHEICFTKFLNPKRPKLSKLGLPILEEVNLKMKKVYEFLEANMDAEFSITKIRESLNTKLPDNRTVKRKLLERYGDKLIIINAKSSTEMICLTNYRRRSCDQAVRKTKRRKVRSKKHGIPVADASNVMDYPICRICEYPITSDIVNIGAKGQKQLIKASHRQQDSKFEQFEENLQLHARCRVAYIAKRRVETRTRVSNDAIEVEVIGRNGYRNDDDSDKDVKNKREDRRCTVSKETRVDNTASSWSNDEWSDQDLSSEVPSAASSSPAFHDLEEDQPTTAFGADNDDADDYCETTDDLNEKPPAYECKLCFRNVTGPRYRCIVCPNLDICSQCEHRGLHATHYVLRVPPRRPMEEVNSILVAVLQALVSLKVPDLNKEPGPSQVKSVNSTRVKNAAPKPQPKQKRQNDKSCTGYNRRETRDVPAEKGNPIEELEVPIPIVIKDEMDPLHEDLHQREEYPPQGRPGVFVEETDQPPVKRRRDNDQFQESSLYPYEMGGERRELIHQGHGKLLQFMERKKSESYETGRSSKETFTSKKPNR